MVEVVSGDCVVIVKDSSLSHGPTWERRVYLAGIRAPGIGHPLRSEAMEFLRTMVIGKHVWTTFLHDEAYRIRRHDTMRRSNILFYR